MGEGPRRLAMPLMGLLTTESKAYHEAGATTVREKVVCGIDTSSQIVYARTWMAGISETQGI